jgi:hypothetical protein
MAAGDTKIEYAASSNLTITLASLASDTNLLAGRESSEVDNTTNKYVDYLLCGKITTGTSPTASRIIEVWVVGLMDDSTYPDVFDGTDSAETITNAGIKNSICRLAASIDTVATSDLAYPFGPVSVASLFGGRIPKKFVVFVTHSTAVNLNSTTGNHQITVTPIYYTTAAS